MALTNSERQAAFKARKAETMDALAQQNAALVAEVADYEKRLTDCGKNRTGSKLQPSNLRSQKQNDQPRHQR